jgi:perosamine synthetase
MKQIDLIRSTFDKTDIKAICNSVGKGGLGTGKYVNMFERKMSHFLENKYALATSSGTAALYLAMKGLNIKEGDEVILPSYTCLTLLNAVLYLNSKPVFVDCNYNIQEMDFNIKLNDIGSKITEKTKAIIVPYMFGTPTNIEELKYYNISIIEDIALSLGAKVEGRKVGNVGDVCIVSFNGKVISTGKGGMLLTNSEHLFSIINDRTNYESKIVSMRTRNINEECGIVHDIGYEMGDIQAVIGINQLKNINNFIDKRIKIAKIYYKAFSSEGLIVADINKTKNSIYFRYIVQTNKDVIKIIEEGKKYNIEYGRGVYPPLHYCYREKGLYTNTERSVNTLISVPIYPSLNDDEIDKIITVTKQLLR